MSEAPYGWAPRDEPPTVQLINTVLVAPGGLNDALSDPGALDEWFEHSAARAGLTAAAPEDLTTARSLRDALRRIAAHVTGDDRPETASPITSMTEALAVVNDLASTRSTARLELDDETLTVNTTPANTAQALAAIAADSIAYFGSDQCARLRACLAPNCALYFTHTHSRREWCTVACGNRTRAARHYRKVRSEQRATTAP